MGYRIELYKALPFVHAKQDTIDAWEAGKDFKIVNGPYCSKRDFNQLKKDFDIIELKWVDNNGVARYHNIYTHILAGVTTYV